MVRPDRFKEVIYALLAYSAILYVLFAVYGTYNSNIPLKWDRENCNIGQKTNDTRNLNPSRLTNNSSKMQFVRGDQEHINSSRTNLKSAEQTITETGN